MCSFALSPHGLCAVWMNIYASPSSGEAYRDRQLTTNFELKFFVCQHVSMWGFQNVPCLSVHVSVSRENKSPCFRQYLSYISNWYIKGKVFTSTTPLKPTNFNFFPKKFKIKFWLVLTSWNHLSFINISPTLVIDTPMERSSLVLHHWNPKNWIFFKVWYWILTCAEKLKSP